MNKNGSRSFLVRFLSSESGATAIEYGLITAGIAVVIATALVLVGDSLSTFFGDLATALSEI